MSHEDLDKNVSAELLHLYELALSIGKSLDPAETCLNFISILVPRYSLMGATVLWSDDKATDLQPFASIPKINSAKYIPGHSEKIHQLVSTGKPVIIPPGDPGHDELADIFYGSAMTFGLYPFSGDEIGNSLGVLIMHAAEPAVISVRRLNSFRPVLNALGKAIQGGLDHQQLVKSEKELNHQRSFAKTLIKTIPDLVWLKDPDGVYLACSQRFEDFFGAKEKEI